MGRPGGIFYGWVIVAVLAVAGAASTALGTLNYGLFIKPMGDELGIGRAWQATNGGWWLTSSERRAGSGDG